jgi:hypothetical protein
MALVQEGIKNHTNWTLEFENGLTISDWNLPVGICRGTTVVAFTNGPVDI